MSSLRRLWAVFVARNKEFLRDRGALAWNLMFPLFVVFGMAFAFNGRNQEVFKIGVAGDVKTLPPGFPVSPKKVLSRCPQTSMPMRALCLFFCASRTARAPR